MRKIIRLDRNQQTKETAQKTYFMSMTKGGQNFLVVGKNIKSAADRTKTWFGFYFPILIHIFYTKLGLIT